ncbi:MAG TPA: hypothetical protein VF998_00900 [Candidatus Limnocylindria bacterium]
MSASDAGPADANVPPGRWIVRGVLLAILSFANLNVIWSPDVIPNALFAWTLVRSGNVDYDEFTYPSPQQERPDRIDREAYFFRACGGSTATEPPRAVRSLGGPPAPGPNDHVCSVFPPGIALLALPVLVPAVLAGVEPGDATALLLLGHLVAAIVETIATLVLWTTLRRFVSPGWSLGLVLLYTLGTSVRTVASQALWQHAGVHLFVALALFLVLVERPVAPLRELVAGVLLGFGAVVRQTTALVALGIGRRRWLWAVAGFGVGVIPLLVYDAVAFGDPFEQGYGTKPFDAPIVTGVAGLLVSPSRGLLVYEPYIAFAIVALVLAWRRPGAIAARLRGLGIVALATLLLYATYAEWWGGRVFGPRFLDDLAPIMFVALGWAIGRGLLASRGVRVAFWATAGWSLALFNAAALVYQQGWDNAREVNFHPERLFDWSDPQWLAVLRSLPSGGARAAVAALLSIAVLALLLRLERVRPFARLSSTA